MCRVCHCEYKHLENQIHDFIEKPHAYWTREEYDSITKGMGQRTGDLSILEEVDEANLFTLDGEESTNESDVSTEENIDTEEELASNTRGVKSLCPFNVLSSFHCVSGFPPDILHDMMEGVIPEDLLGIIRILDVKGWFTVLQYNKILERLEFSSYESADKPYPVPTSKSVKKLKGKAVSNWVHLRNWPILIKQLVTNINYSDPVLNLGLKLHEICERMTAVEFFNYEIDILEVDMKNELNVRKFVLLIF